MVNFGSHNRRGTRNPGPSRHPLWSELSDSTRRKYKSQGVSPQTYNAWYQKSPTQRAILSAKAKREGYESGWDAARKAPVKQLDKLREQLTDLKRELWNGSPRWDERKAKRNSARGDSAAVREGIKILRDQLNGEGDIEWEDLSDELIELLGYH